MIFLGIDVGTQGVRALACDLSGQVLAVGEHSLPPVSDPYPGWREQSPEDWWDGTKKALASVMQELAAKGVDPGRVGGIAVDSTSGTVVPVDSAGIPLRNAIMYNDSRAGKEAATAQASGREMAEKLGYSFAPSFALAKILWIRNHEPAVYEQTRYFLHAADYVSGQLTGEWGVTDHTNALKTGFDLVLYRWPDFIAAGLGLDLDRFPRVIPPGKVIGQLGRRAADELGLSPGTKVVAGMTDGCAGQVASGALEPGQSNTTLGTTLVIKGIAPTLVKDPRGRVYSHLHPEGYWMPGGASNTGAECLLSYPRDEWANLDREALRISPTGLVIYPLERSGERFPFLEPGARGFRQGDPANRVQLYAGLLEGVAFLERVALEFLSELGVPKATQVHTTGGGSRSREWCQIRADILGCPVVKPHCSEAAMGMAIVAASNLGYDSLSEAGRAMVRIAERYEPDLGKISAYDQIYGRFLDACRDRGYI